MSIAPLNAIPRAIAVERRRSRRIQVLLPVEVEIGGERQVARITEMSRAGARIELRGPRGIGETLIVRRNGIELKARVVWSLGLSAGLLFDEAMDENSFIQLRRRTVG